MSRFILTVAVLLLVTSFCAQAALIAEWDFQIDEDLTYAPDGVTRDASLRTNTTVDTGPTGLTGSWGPELKNGQVQFQGADGDDGLAVGAGYAGLFGTNKITDTSFEMVIRPEFNGHPSTRYLFTMGKWHKDDAVGATADESVTVKSNATATSASDAVSLVSGSWYYIAGSWAPDQNVLLYIREMPLSGPEGAAAASVSLSSTAVPSATSGDLIDSMAIGARSRGDFDNAFLGDMAYIRFYDQFRTSDQLDAAFDSLIPEPGSAALLTIALSALLARRRKSRART